MIRVVLFVLCALLASTAWAGRSCEELKLTPESVRKALDLAERTRSALEQSGGKAALVARVGKDLSRYELRYSHVGYALRDHPQGRWLVVHQLNQCGTAESGIFVEGLGNFFLDDMFAYETAILVPGEETQRRLVSVLESAKSVRFHGLRYNMLAYAYSPRYQNSNQWALELFAAAAGRDSRVETRAAAQAWLKAAGYQPITVQIDAVTRLGARMFRANVAFDDHPFDRRMAGQIDTVTVESVYRFIEQREPQHKKIHLQLD
jgi:hypothetical protein